MNENWYGIEKEIKNQWDFINIFKPLFFNWLKQEKIIIYDINFVPCGKAGIGIYIFYKTEKILKQYQCNSITEKTQKKIFEIFKDIGYFNNFSEKLRFEFDSDENVKKNYEGNYFYRLR